MTNTDNLGMTIEIKPSVQQVKDWAVSILSNETDIRETISRLEVKLKEMKMLAEAVKQEGKPREVTESDIYPNRHKTNFVGD
jgi:hypothetical protein